MPKVVAIKKEKTEKPHHSGHRQRLRERFLAHGESLANYEVLEMLLFSAHPRGDVKPLAKSLLAYFGSFAKVMHATPQELQKVDGIGEAAVTAIKVAKAAAERMLKEEFSDRPIIKSWTQLLDYCRLHIGHIQNEEFHVLFLNHKLELIVDERQQRGTIDHTPVYPREVVKRALELGASSLILVHNHPSGDVTPSKADIDVTQQIIVAARALNIEVHDHVIIGAKKHFSFKSKGIL